MNLVIEDKLFDNKAKAFAEWLIPVLRQHILKNINVNKLKSFEDYINKDRISLKLGFTRFMSISSIVKAALFNLVVTYDYTAATIEFDPDVTIPNSNAKFIDIVNLINYGNLSLQSYPIFDEAFNLFAENGAMLFKKFKEENA